MDVKKVFQVSAENTGTFLNDPGLGLYVPAYQRSYSWDTTNVDRLVQDLVDGTIRSQSNPEAMTFLGALIQVVDPRPASVHPKVQSDLPKGVTLLIDGQQRLTTILMLNVCLREALKRASKRLPKELPDEVSGWFEKKRLRLQRDLLESLQITMPGGDEGYEHYPRMIRAHRDTWSSSSKSAKYDSPIAHLLHGYARHAANADSDKREFKFSFEKERKKQHREFYSALARVGQLLREIEGGEGKRVDEMDEFNSATNSEAVRKLLLGDDCPAPQEETAALVRLLIVGHYLQDRVCVTSVSVTEEDYAFDMFEALNTTGEPLTAFETLKPRIVEAEGLEDYGESQVKEHVDVVEGYFRAKSQAARRRDTARIVTFFALAESGEKRSRKLSEQRQYLRRSFPADADTDADTAARIAYVAHLRYLTDFVDQLWEPEDVSTAWSHPLFDGDSEGALAMRALSAANHEITVAPLVQWYQAWIDAGKTSDAATEFRAVVKGLAAFFAIWRLTHADTANVDGLIRGLMKDGHEDPVLLSISRSNRSGGPPPASKLLAALRKFLELSQAKIVDEDAFTRRMMQTPAYERARAHTRLLLLMASNDSVADPGEPGSLMAGTKGVNPMFSRDRWDQTAETIEHIAPQSAGAIDFWDDLIYETEGAIHRLGNLTILPIGLNAALGNRDWQSKRHIYDLLTATTPEDAKELRIAAQKAGVDVPDSWSSDHPYQAQVESLSSVENWTLEIIDRRSSRLSTLAWRSLRAWLQWE